MSDLDPVLMQSRYDETHAQQADKDRPEKDDMPVPPGWARPSAFATATRTATSPTPTGPCPGPGGVHKLEAIYNYDPPGKDQLPNDFESWTESQDQVDIIGALTKKTYVGHVCHSCGLTVRP